MRHLASGRGLRVLVLAVASLALLTGALAAHVDSADAMWCSAEYRSCASDDEVIGGGDGGGGALIPSRDLKARGYTCNWGTWLPGGLPQTSYFCVKSGSQTYICPEREWLGFGDWLCKPY